MFVIITKIGTLNEVIWRYTNICYMSQMLNLLELFLLKKRKFCLPVIASMHPCNCDCSLQQSLLMLKVPLFAELNYRLPKRGCHF